MTTPTPSPQPNAQPSLEGARNILQRIVATVKAHDIESLQCDGREEEYCNCLSKLIERAEKELATPRTPSLAPGSAGTQTPEAPKLHVCQWCSGSGQDNDGEAFINEPCPKCEGAGHLVAVKAWDAVRADRNALRGQVEQHEKTMRGFYSDMVKALGEHRSNHTVAYDIRSVVSQITALAAERDAVNTALNNEAKEVAQRGCRIMVLEDELTTLRQQLEALRKEGFNYAEIEACLGAEACFRLMARRDRIRNELAARAAQQAEGKRGEDRP